MQPSHRRIIALCGPREWCHQSALALLCDHDTRDIVWAGDTVPAELAITPLAHRQQILGDEYGAAIIDAWSGFDPEQFGALSGTVRGGGALLLLLPPLEEWPLRPDPAQQRIAVWPHTPATMANHFITRVIAVLRHHPAIEWLSPQQPLPAPLKISTALPAATPPLRSAEQQQAIVAIHHVVHGHRRRPLVLMADRGRGKSAALGFAAAELLAQGLQRIIVTAPHRHAVTSLFEHAIGSDPRKDTRITLAGGTSVPNTATPHDALQFIPPDELLRHPHPCDLLLIDEAAAIPAPMLRQLLQRHARIVFATTVHGYEGSGRGFALRFFKVLDREAPGWRLLELQQPIRWAAGDPLERLTYELLLLDAAPAANEVIAEAPSAEIHYATLEHRELQSNDTLLAELFGLLVLAHYRTTPLDLRQLLDSPNLAVHVARYRGHIVGTAITLREGGFDHALAAQIYSGERRPRGHLAPQSLAFHCGLPEAPLLITGRLMRIAVHPALQHRGIGTALVAHIAARARDDGIDYLSTSFGATPELLHFWQRSAFGTAEKVSERDEMQGARSTATETYQVDRRGSEHRATQQIARAATYSAVPFLPVRIGLTREASSGCHSALLLHPLSAAGMALFARARRRFLNALPLLLGEPLQDLDPEIAGELLSGEPPGHTLSLDEDDWRDLHSFAFTQRGYESCLGAIHKLARQAVANPLLMSELEAIERQLLISKVMQQRPWHEVTETYGLSGKEAAVKLLRRTVREIVQAMRPGNALRHDGRSG